MVERVALTPAAADLLVGLTRVHGPLMFHQSGGCCDGSAPMCYPLGEFKLGGTDIHPHARLMAVADSYDAMTSARPYRNALPAE